MIKAIIMGIIFFIVTTAMERFFANKRVNFKQWFIAAVVYTIIYRLITLIWR